MYVQVMKGKGERKKKEDGDKEAKPHKEWKSQSKVMKWVEKRSKWVGEIVSGKEEGLGKGGRVEVLCVTC